MIIRSADLCDRAGAEAHVCLAPWRSYGGRSALNGQVATLRTPEDAALLRKHLGTPGEGRILVVDAGGAVRAAILGENMARLGLTSGWSGVLIYGAIRDADDLCAMDFGVFALGSVPVRGGNLGTGEWGVELEIGGASVRPGDFMAIDSDGVAIARHAPAG